MTSSSFSSADSFADRVYTLVSRIPRGTVCTYSDIAFSAGSPRAYRAVGHILSKNTDPKNIPCHRVVRSDGFCGEYAFGGVCEKIKKLRLEGILINEAGKIQRELSKKTP